MGRVGRMEELQNLATFLLADGCEWLTGEMIAIDGATASRVGRRVLRSARVGRRAVARGARRDPRREREGPRGARALTGDRRLRRHYKVGGFVREQVQ